ncbi:MAG: radical SAM protein [Vicinamibacteria bacterium]|nr:radical SAM protein [Vicinamibacteria bacterium]
MNERAASRASVHLRGLTPEALVARFPEIGFTMPQARRVITRLVHHYRDDLRDIPGLKKTKAEALMASARLDQLEVMDRRRSSVDPFVKYLFRAGDGRVFETVRIPLEQPRWSVCVSSQAGCALRCAFCETGRMGFERNLEPWEIVDQVLRVRSESPERPVTGVVFQGQGEPFQNYENVMTAADVLRHPCGGRIGSDRITISTVGLLPMMDRYVDEGRPYRLILSLTSAFPEKRELLLPVASKWPVDALADSMKRLSKRQRNVINLAWVLMSGVNTGADEARELGRLFKGERVRVSVIDVNDPTGRFVRAGDEERGQFLNALSANGIPFVRRYSGGPDIHAACGMLARHVQGGEAHAV